MCGWREVEIGGALRISRAVKLQLVSPGGYVSFYIFQNSKCVKQRLKPNGNYGF